MKPLHDHKACEYTSFEVVPLKDYLYKPVKLETEYNFFMLIHEKNGNNNITNLHLQNLTL